MKQLLNFVFISLSMLIVPFEADASCDPFATNHAFSRHMHYITVQRSEHQRLLASSHFVRKYCVNTVQVKRMMNRLRSDRARYDLAITAIPNLTDGRNAHQLRYALRSTSTRRDFDYFLEQLRRQGRGRGVGIHAPGRSYSFPQWNYPTVSHYSGHRGCNSYMAEHRFHSVADQLIRLRSDHARFHHLRTYASSYNFTVAQFMKLLSFIESEGFRYDLVSIYSESLYDQAQLHCLLDCFDNQLYRSRFEREFLGRGPGGNHGHHTLVNEYEYDEMIRTLQMEAFDKDKLMLARQMVDGPKYLTSRQLAGMMHCMSFDQNKLSLAKYAYSRVADPQNYHLLNRELTFSSNKRELMDYVNRH